MPARIGRQKILRIEVEVYLLAKWNCINYTGITQNLKLRFNSRIMKADNTLKNKGFLWCR